MLDSPLQQLINQSLRKANEERKKKKVSFWPTDLGGKCLSGAYYRRQGLEPDSTPDDRTLRIFKCGNLFEQFVIDQLKETGETYETQVRLEIPEYDLTGYADLLLGDIVYEIKSVHSRKFWWMQTRNEGPDTHYLCQLYAGMMALGKQEGRLIYLSKDDLTVAEYPLLIANEKIRTMVISELEVLNKAWRDQVPPEPVETIVNGKLNWMAVYCDYHSHCLNDKDWLAKAQQQLKDIKAPKAPKVATTKQ